MSKSNLLNYYLHYIYYTYICLSLSLIWPIIAQTLADFDFLRFIIDITNGTNGCFSRRVSVGGLGTFTVESH